MKPSYAHILLEVDSTRLSSQCSGDGKIVVNYSWEVCPIDFEEGPFGVPIHVFNDEASGCDTSPQDSGMNICYLGPDPATNVFGS